MPRLRNLRTRRSLNCFHQTRSSSLHYFRNNEFPRKQSSRFPRGNITRLRGRAASNESSAIRTNSSVGRQSFEPVQLAFPFRDGGRPPDLFAAKRRSNARSRRGGNENRFARDGFLHESHRNVRRSKSLIRQRRSALEIRRSRSQVETRATKMRPGVHLLFATFVIFLHGQDCSKNRKPTEPVARNSVRPPITIFHA